MAGLIEFLPILLLVIALVGVYFLCALCFRVVVSTNDVHIVQSAKKTISYGKDQPAGNSYYVWPAWIPAIGVKVIKLPVSVFSVELDAYAAYDKGRVPFVIDIMAFFRIEDSNVAAQRVHSFQELVDQLKGILQGACRSILAKAEIEEILEERAKYGEQFTAITNDQLNAWGVVNVKNIELMDIRDASGSKVIDNIMSKKKSMIEMQSRVEVARNNQTAQEAEIKAKRSVEISQQEADEQVGIRTAEKERQVGISKQQASQAIKEQERATAERSMAIMQVNQVRQAEITRDVQVVNAEQDKRTQVIKAEGEKQKTITVAEGALESAKLHAQGVEAEGRAKGEAEKAVLLAPVQAQITLAKEIGENQGYQNYLISVRRIDADQAVGIEQAHALQKADVKIIANTGDPIQGVDKVMDLFTSKGGTQFGAMLEAFKQTPAGEALLKKVNGSDGAARPATK
jgi:flotillin